MLTARTILCPNLLQMSRQHPEEDKAYIQNDAHKSTEAPRLEGNGWLLAKIARPHILKHVPMTFMWSQLAKWIWKCIAHYKIVSPMEKTHWWIQGYKMIKHHIIKRLPWDVGLKQRIKLRNSELRSKVFMLTSRTESSRLLKSHNKKSITIKVNRTDISPLDQYTSLRCITYAGPVTCCFIITYHPVANQCYRLFII